MKSANILIFAAIVGLAAASLAAADWRSALDRGRSRRRARRRRVSADAEAERDHRRLLRGADV